MLEPKPRAGGLLSDGRSEKASARVRGLARVADSAAEGTLSRCFFIQVVIIEIGTGGSWWVGAGYSGSASSPRAAKRMVRARFCGSPKVPETQTPMRTW